MSRAFLTLMAVCFSAAVMGTSVEDCEKPSAPSGVPDGASATESEMIEAQGEVKDFVAEGQEFLACVQEVIAVVEADVKAEVAEGGEATASQQAAARKHKELVGLHNSTIEEMEEAAGKFNEALQAYNSR